MAAGLLCVMALALALAACGDGETETVGAEPPASGGSSTTSRSISVSSSTVPTPTSQRPAAAGLSGIVVRRTDVATLPERPVTAGAVVVVPDAAVKGFWAAVGLPETGPPVPGKAEFVVDPALLPRGAVVAKVVDGRFSTEVKETRVLLCIADDLPGDRQGPPHRVNGCARYEGGAGSGAVRLSSGLGGVMAGPA